ncbi:unnamed protein product [Closterium sp. NIES-65]|nr:unnamed protein product [Closterium sp. NIES-65]
MCFAGVAAVVAAGRPSLSERGGRRKAARSSATSRRPPPTAPSERLSKAHLAHWGRSLARAATCAQQPHRWQQPATWHALLPACALFDPVLMGRRRQEECLCPHSNERLGNKMGVDVHNVDMDEELQHLRHLQHLHLTILQTLPIPSFMLCQEPQRLALSSIADIRGRGKHSASGQAKSNLRREEWGGKSRTQAAFESPATIYHQFLFVDDHLSPCMAVWQFLRCLITGSITTYLPPNPIPQTIT